MATVLIDASMPREVATALRDLGHIAIDVRDIGMAHHDDHEFAAYARGNGMAVASCDYDFADILEFPPVEHHGIVVFEQRAVSPEGELIESIRLVFANPMIVANLVGHLFVCEKRNVRAWPAMEERS